MRQRNSETSYCEIRKARWGSSGVEEILDHAGVIKGAEHAAETVERLDRKLTDEEKK
jgi:hypothetical protein